MRDYVNEYTPDAPRALFGFCNVCGGNIYLGDMYFTDDPESGLMMCADCVEEVVPDAKDYGFLKEATGWA